MKTYARSERVRHEIQKIISQVLLKDIKDPRLKKATITYVDMTSDLRLAKVFYILPDDDPDKDKVAKGFKSAVGYIKRVVASNIDLKYMPDIRFYYDETVDNATRINKILNKVTN